MHAAQPTTTMKPFRCRGLPVLFSACIALILFTWFRAMVGYEFPPVRHRMFWEIQPIIEIGRVLARPMYAFVSNVMTRIDFRYACADAWHPVFRIGLTILWIGYTGSFWLAWTWIGHEINRRRMK